MTEYNISVDGKEIERVSSIRLCARNISILELNNLCMIHNGYLDVDEEEVVLAEVRIVEKI
jgi:hypothetical protein